MFNGIRNLFRRRRRRVQLAHERKPTSLRMRILVRSLLAVLVLAVVAAMFPYQVSFRPAGYLEGSVSPEEIIAPFDFEVPKPADEVEGERARAAEEVLPVFVQQARVPVYTRLVARLGAVRADSLGLARVLDSLRVGLAPATLALLAGPDSGVVLLGEAEKLLAEVAIGGLVLEEDAGVVARSARIRVRTQAGDELVATGDIYVPGRVRGEAADRGMQRLGAAGAVALPDLVSSLVVADLAYDPEATAAARDVARAAVPSVRGVVKRGERIVDSHQRITLDHVVALQALREAMIQRADQRGWTAWVQPLLGRALLVAVALVLFGLFLRVARRDIWDDLGLLTALTLIVMVTLAIAGSVARSQDLHPFLVPIPVAAIMATLLLDEAVALAAVSMVAGLVGAVSGWGLSVTLVGGVGGVISVFAMRNVFQRWEFLRSIAPIGAGMVATLVGAALVGATLPGSNLLGEIGWTLGSAALSVAIAMFLSPLFERIFHLASNITLLELSDLNRPIFKRMMLEANGTYHHSMVVGSLAEAAAEAVKASPLMARVGGYYHDIGKIAKSGYFGENLRRGMKNPHEKLTPTMSSLILESHVREGLELAREIGLPTSVADFIPEHQGTTLMQYFYNKAMEMDPEVDERDYRYPGPRPQTKETAIVMLADTAEASVRSLDEQTPNRIRAVLTRMFEARIADGQLDECGLTMADLAKIRDAFTHVLSGVYHGRVKYQWQKDGGEEALEGGEERVFHPELETAIGTREAPRGFARTSQAAGKVDPS